VRAPRADTLPGQARLRVRDGAVATEWFDYLFLPPDELPSLLDGTPWRLREVHQQGAAYAVHLDRVRGQGSEK